MMSAFLDALGVTHDNGLIGEEMKPPPSERLASAAKTLTASYPAEDVKLYFSALISQDPDTWGELSDHV